MAWKVFKIAWVTLTSAGTRCCNWAGKKNNMHQLWANTQLMCELCWHLFCPWDANKMNAALRHSNTEWTEQSGCLEKNVNAVSEPRVCDVTVRPDTPSINIVRRGFTLARLNGCSCIMIEDAQHCLRAGGALCVLLLHTNCTFSVFLF